jgi:ectoine hydroxylase-related dioxygenase (phytanoyl-CoA dioxygenase family)
VSEVVRDVTRKAVEVLRRARRGALRRARSLLGPDSKGLWLDREDAPRELERRTEDPFLREHAGNLIRDGVTRVTGAVSPELCDSVIAAFRRYCEANSQAASFRDGHGHSSRLCNFHLASSEALDVGLHPRALRLLDFLFGRRAAICGSLTFNKGTQQELHRDSPFFHTHPEGFFFGVWTALEDVSPEAGPLMYYPGGHRLRIDRLELAARHPGASPRELLNAYSAELRQRCERSGLAQARALAMRKGDMLLWHPQLPHADSPIADPRLTRYSILFHYMPEGVPTHGIEAFFSQSFPSVPNPLRTERGRMLLEHGQARFDQDS